MKPATTTTTTITTPPTTTITIPPTTTITTPPKTTITTPTMTTPTIELEIYNIGMYYFSSVPVNCKIPKSMNRHKQYKYNTIDTTCKIQYIQPVQYNIYNLYNTIDTTCTIQ